MKNLFVLNMGIGNVTETIPLYMSLKDEMDLDVVYMREYPTDSFYKADCFPCENIKEINIQRFYDIMNDYEYVIKPPIVTQLIKKEHQYIYENIVSLRELDSEVERNMKISDFFGFERKYESPVRMEESPFEGDIVICNGALPGWERKKYPQMDAVAQELSKNYKVTSIGSSEEYVNNTIDGTGTSLRVTAGTINNHSLYIGTDTGCTHIAAALKKRGIVIYTATDPRKNYDSIFHSSLEKIHTFFPCQPCQWGYRTSPFWHKCQQHMCQTLSPSQVVEMVELIMNGVL